MTVAMFTLVSFRSLGTRDPTQMYFSAMRTLAEIVPQLHVDYDRISTMSGVM